jgi:hypothetical protein
MYRISPFTYIVGGMIPTGVSRTRIVCSASELVNFDPPAEETCSQYMSAFLSNVGGYLVDPEATKGCSYCSAETTDELLAQFGISYGTRWRDFGLLWVYVLFNIAVAVGLYWLVRVVSCKVFDLCYYPADLPSRRRRRRRRNSRSSTKTDVHSIVHGRRTICKRFTMHLYLLYNTLILRLRILFHHPIHFLAWRHRSNKRRRNLHS